MRGLLLKSCRQNVDLLAKKLQTLFLRKINLSIIIYTTVMIHTATWSRIFFLLCILTIVQFLNNTQSLRMRLRIFLKTICFVWSYRAVQRRSFLRILINEWLAFVRSSNWGNRANSGISRIEIFLVMVFFWHKRKRHSTINLIIIL